MSGEIHASRGNFKQKFASEFITILSMMFFPNVCPTACFSEEQWLTRKAAWLHRSNSGPLSVERWNAMLLVSTTYVYRDFSTQASTPVPATTAVPMGYNPFKLRFISLHSN